MGALAALRVPFLIAVVLIGGSVVTHFGVMRKLYFWRSGGEGYYTSTDAQRFSPFYLRWVALFRYGYSGFWAFGMVHVDLEFDYLAT